jgi:Holliday junction resolvase
MFTGYFTKEKIMALTPEKKVKDNVVKQLKQLGSHVYYFFPATGGYGRSGVPDIVGCFNGKFWAIECKAGKNTTTALQDRELNAIRSARGEAWVVNEANVDAIGTMLRKLL